MSKPGRKPAATIDHDLLDGLAELSFEVMGRLTLLAAEEDLSLTQLRVLAVLRDRRPRMAELADALGLDRSSVTGLVARAERRGLVERVTDAEDGRGKRVQLTEHGRAFADTLSEKALARVADLMAPLDAATRRSLAQILGRALAARHER